MPGCGGRATLHGEKPPETAQTWRHALTERLQTGCNPVTGAGQEIGKATRGGGGSDETRGTPCSVGAVRAAGRRARSRTEQGCDRELQNAAEGDREDELPAHVRDLRSLCVEDGVAD